MTPRTSTIRCSCRWVTFLPRAHAELDPDEPIIVLCHHGARSLNVTMWLRAQGFEHVQSLSGGIDKLVQSR